MRIRKFIYGEAPEYVEFEGGTIEDFIRTQGGLPDTLLQNGVEFRVNAVKVDRYYELSDGDTLVISPAKSEGGK